MCLSDLFNTYGLFQPQFKLSKTAACQVYAPLRRTCIPALWATRRAGPWDRARADSGIRTPC